MKIYPHAKHWWHSAVIYQIYPRSFNDSNGDGIGDLPGIIEKLDHIAGLGVDVIWLSPVYKSPMDDNGYDISDYYDIAPEFGTMADMDKLIEEAAKKNIKIVMDLVANHTSDEHPWFKEAISSKDNPKRDWYIWRDPQEDGGPPNNWDSFFTPSAWEIDEKSNQYYLHLFSKKQPDLNWANPEVRNAIYEMMHFWLKKGIGGFRMDTINMIGKPADLPDATIFDEGVAGWEHWANTDLCHYYLREMNEKVLRHYDVMTVGETPFTTTRDGRFYSHPERHEVSMIFQFDHVSIDREEHNAKAKPFDLVEYKRVMSKWQNDLHLKGWNSVYWSNHDQPRTVSRYGNDSDEYRDLSAKMLGTVLHMMNGTPYIYQGEELALTNSHFSSIDDFNDLMAKFHYQKLVESGTEPKQALDFLNRYSRDHARTPMPWNAKAHAGFTSGEPWLALNSNYPKINAEITLADKNSVYYHYKELVKLRKCNHYGNTIVYGSYTLLDAEDSDVYAYVREYDGIKLLVIANFTGEKQRRHYDFKLLSLCLNNYHTSLHTLGEELELEPYQALVLQVK
jgi:oligo-1,6-glucosidase